MKIMSKSNLFMQAKNVTCNSLETAKERYIPPGKRQLIIDEFN